MTDFLGVTLHGMKQLRDRMREIDKQTRFASMVALNRTATAIRNETVAEMQRVFDRPTPRTLGGMFTRSARRDNLEAWVGLKDVASKGTPPAKYLAAEVAGGSRRQKGLERKLQHFGYLPAGWYAVPGEAAPLDAYGNFPGGYVQRMLSQLQIAETHAGSTQNSTAKTRQKFKKKHGFAFFLVPPGRHRTLTPGIYARHDFYGGTAVKPVVIFVRRADYNSRLKFGAIAEEIMARRYPDEFYRALDQALATAR